ncbi:MAG: DivIVA domain-containing protein [Clostridia bacterium]
MLSPVDIDNKTFKKSRFSGYDVDDVEDFLVLIMEDYEKLFKENSELKDKVNTLQESVSYYKSVEEGISQTIENAQTSAEEIKQKALSEAEQIKKKYEVDSHTGLEEMKLEVRKVEIELEEKKKQMQIYKIRVSSMLEAQLKILKDENLDD